MNSSSKLVLLALGFFVALLFVVIVAAAIYASRWVLYLVVFLMFALFIFALDVMYRREQIAQQGSNELTYSTGVAPAITSSPRSSLTPGKPIKRSRVRLGSGHETSVSASREPARRHIEEIHDLLGRLTSCAESLYQYGNPDDALNLLADLSLNDQKRLLCLALVEGRREYTGNAVKQMLLRLDPRYTDLEAVLTNLPSEDRAEIEKSRLRALEGELPDEPKAPAEPTEFDRQRITDALREVADEIGLLSYEDAVWVLIPRNPEEEVVWVEAVRSDDPALSKVRLSWMTLYQPGKEERYELITMMRRALWVLHAHNHPREFPEEPEVPEASPEDRAVSVSWKYARPELVDKMKFFTVTGSRVVEYSMQGNLTKEWPI